jgi:ABC-2 type transport system permease protein
MSKIGIIIRREYKTRVRNRTFILLTFLAPVFYGLLMLMPLLAAELGKETRTVEVVDESHRFQNVLLSDQKAVFIFRNEPISQVKQELKKAKESSHYILYIPKNLNIYEPKGIELISKKNIGATFKSYTDSLLANRISAMKMEELHLDRPLIDSLKTTVDVSLQKTTDKGLEESSGAATTAASLIGGILIYIFIFLYGSLVLRGVQEEKQNRVVEIIISSVKPFELMMGKIIGIAFVGLSQFVVWVLLTIVVVSISGQAIGIVEGHASMAAQTTGAQVAFDKAAAAINTLPLGLLIGMFIFFFIGGYLLYSSLFAAFAAAVDSQTDIYQFMFPISLPIIFSISLIPAIIDNPDSSIAFWFSIIPFTSPVIMMARLPFEVPVWQLVLSMALLISGFLCTTWLAAKIYRTGILMYGKKITYREIIKWVFYKS